MTAYGPPEKVYVELDYYDGPRGGVADFGGIPHRFGSLFGETEDDYSGTFLIWPIDPEMLALEVEQWRIFTAWNALYEAGKVGTETHPGHGGLDARWDELDRLLQAGRSEVPADARKARVEFVPLDAARYAPEGPAYQARWAPEPGP